MALLEDEATITLADGNAYTVAALTLDQVIEAESLIGAVSSGDARLARDGVVRVLGYALARRHPEVTPEMMGGQLLTMRNLSTVLLKIFAVSGMATPEGEARAAQA